MSVNHLMLLAISIQLEISILTFFFWLILFGPCSLLLNVFSALEGTFYKFTAAGVVPCSGRKTSPLTSSYIAQIIFPLCLLKSESIF